MVIPRAFPTVLAVGFVAFIGCKNKASEPAGGEADPDERRASADTALPGAEPFALALHQKMRAEAERQGSGDAEHVNRLVFESSPYLRQHAHNPVNWYPWGQEAFTRAKELDRPIFLSVGYSTCHWCHVMERESFEDPEIAAYLNQHFVAIKVDREERPDVDSIYMTAVTMMTGNGGWPMTVFMTPDKVPFFGSTYMPPRAGVRGANMGFLELMQRIQKGWSEERGAVMESADKLGRGLRDALRPPIAGQTVSAASVIRKAAAQYRARFDATWGGLTGTRSKFPSSLPIRFLLRYARRSGDDEYREMALLTLRKMAAGGIHDHVGGGFHRYATDRTWLVPHFEKMLYDNALLVQAYLDGYQVTGDQELARVARRILAYVSREMSAPEGGFYSASDADSAVEPGGDREEGAFFVWTPAQIDAALPDDSALVKAYFDVTEGGDYEGKNVLWTPEPLAKVAREQDVPLDEARRTVGQALETLQQARARRPRPPRDEKILAAWNGLMISAFARAERVLGGGEYVGVARRAATRLLGDMRRPDGRLLRSLAGGEAKLDAYLDDYAFVIAALIDLFELTGETRWLEEARALDELLAEHYEDGKMGGFFLVADDHEELLAREKPADDGALPSGNSVAAMNLVRLHELTGEDSYRVRAERLLSAFAERLERDPTTASEMLLALDAYTDAVRQIVIVTPETRAEAAPLLAELQEAYLPSQVLVVVSEDEVDTLAKLVPLVEGKKALGGKPTAYVCEQGRCELPAKTPELFARQIAEVKPLPEAE